MSLTLNAPEGSFNNPDQAFFGGRGLDDLFWPMHLNFQFFGMEAMETFACYDVMKNPSIEKDFERFTAHLGKHFLIVKGMQYEQVFITGQDEVCKTIDGDFEEFVIIRILACMSGLDDFHTNS